MKINKYLTLSIVSILVWGTSFQKKETKTTSTSTKKLAYKIQVTVKGLKDTVCYLANYYGDKQYLKDTAKVDSKGYFEFIGTETLPGGIYMVVLPGKKYFEVIVDKEQFFSLQTDTLDYIKNLKNSTSRENSIFYEYMQYVAVKSVFADSVKKKYDIIVDKNSELANSYKKQLEGVDKEVIEWIKIAFENAG